MRNNADLGCLGKIVAFIVAFFGFIGGNVFLITGEGDEYPLCVFMGIICDVILVGFIVKVVYENLNKRKMLNHRILVKQAIESELEYCVTTCEHVKNITDKVHAEYAMVELISLCDEWNRHDLQTSYAVSQIQQNGQVFMELKQAVPRYEVNSFPLTPTELPAYYSDLKRKIGELRADMQMQSKLSDAEVEKLYEKYRSVCKYMQMKRKAN